MALDPDIAAQVAHLFDATLAQVLSGEVSGPPSARPMCRADVTAVEATVPGPNGPVPVRIYRPVGVEGVLPGLVWAHGGGWQYGSLDMPEADSVAQVVAATLPAVVVSVDYRLAPAHRFPAPLDDIVAAHHWATSAGDAHGIDPQRIALGGASAGGHLAIAAALAFRDAGTRLPAALVLAYPVTDPLGGPYPEQGDPECPPLLWLDADAVGGLFDALIGGRSEVPPAAVPARADLRGLPPLLVTIAECDALALQDERFADRARTAGVDVTVHRAAGVLHGYLNTVGDSRAADRALERHVDWLRARVGSPETRRAGMA